MAEQLEQHIGELVVVFEKNAFVQGTIRDVIDDSMLVMENITKNIGVGALAIGYSAPTIFISICEIKEFLTFVPGLSTITTLDKLNFS
ncbi:hypothetical protein [Bacillus sp. Cr_A10]|uniref:hypothetical protein n=1 Tax=Bacillus sp. Cr_A10 TaxID=3033993 RepID=UPI0023D995E7|nr:hypothetical protein [Bacillus sp. Cr_A10]MDF2066581.1 hypothetical protein [Bacillus sp. Cr_A10]